MLESHLGATQMELGDRDGSGTYWTRGAKREARAGLRHGSGSWGGSIREQASRVADGEVRGRGPYNVGVKRLAKAGRVRVPGKQVAGLRGGMGAAALSFPPPPGPRL